MAVVSNGTTIIDAGALGSGVATGKMILLATQTASGSANLSFTSGIDSTYDSYVFKCIDIHPSASNPNFGFQVEVGTGTSYAQTITSTYFAGYQNEAGSTTGFGYISEQDQAQGTGLQSLADQIGNGNDESCAGVLHLFEPSSGTFVKHFTARFQGYNGADFSTDLHVAGYVNTTTALTRVQFKFSSGNIDSGVIKMYGIGG